MKRMDYSAQAQNGTSDMGKVEDGTNRKSSITSDSLFLALHSLEHTFICIGTIRLRASAIQAKPSRFFKTRSVFSIRNLLESQIKLLQLN